MATRIYSGRYEIVEHIAREPHDIPVNYIITEVATYAVV